MELQIDPKSTINIEITTRRPKIGIDIDTPHSGAEYPIYHGQTLIKPEAYDMQVLETENTVLKENIVVLPIPYFETSNPQGGLTIYIGE